MYFYRSFNNSWWTCSEKNWKRVDGGREARERATAIKCLSQFHIWGEGTDITKQPFRRSNLSIVVWQQLIVNDLLPVYIPLWYWGCVVNVCCQGFASQFESFSFVVLFSIIFIIQQWHGGVQKMRDKRGGWGEEWEQEGKTKLKTVKK